MRELRVQPKDVAVAKAKLSRRRRRREMKRERGLRGRVIIGQMWWAISEGNRMENN
jgi:hypothetical protein